MIMELEKSEQKVMRRSRTDRVVFNVNGIKAEAGAQVQIGNAFLSHLHSFAKNEISSMVFVRNSDESRLSWSFDRCQAPHVLDAFWCKCDLPTRCSETVEHRLEVALASN